MAHIHKKIKKGRPYYYVRETARVNGKPKVVNQVYLGSPERIMEMAAGTQQPIAKLQVQEFGSVMLANKIEAEFDLAAIVDEVAGSEKDQHGLSIGDYFVYAILNRMINARSKRGLPEWYKTTAIQQLRPANLEQLGSRQYWRKWEQVSEERLREIARRFFARVATQQGLSSDCFLFDTTNYYTYMAGTTESDLAKRGKNKDGKDWLRQVGLALLVSRTERLPLFYREYEGNRHDSKVFLKVLDEVIEAMGAGTGDQPSVTVVFDKGMNGLENMTVLDRHPGLHFITTYSTAYSEALVRVGLDRFEVLDTDRNRLLEERGRAEDRLRAWRTSGEYWGSDRTVVVTYNPLTATKQRCSFEKKLLRLQEQLFEMQQLVQAARPHWRKKEQVLARYEDICAQLYLPRDLYTLELYTKDGALRMNFRKNHHRLKQYIARFGKNILITSRDQWSTAEIVQASLDRYKVEEAFRQSKDDDLVSLMPLYHWTDSKIRCHILCCVVALTYLRVIENRLAGAGLKITAKTAMDRLRTLHSCLVFHPGKRKPQRIIEEPTEDQAEILAAFGLGIDGGVLREL